MNPQIYKHDSFNKVLNCKAEDVWKSNENKIKIGRENNFFVVVVWEKAINKDLKFIVKRVASLINNREERSIEINWSGFRIIEKEII